jgi:uncharacterized membrane protein YhhN
MSRRLDVVSLVAGLALAALGGLLLADELDALSLGFAYFTPALVATVGVVLLVRGLHGGRRG